MPFTATIKERRHGRARLGRLDAAVTLRNGIAHNDEAKIRDAASHGARPTLRSYADHRRALECLAVDMDDAVAHHLHALIGEQRPW